MILIGILYKNRFKRLRTPANVLVMNLTVCDFISCLIHPMAIYSAYRGRWSFGKTGKSITINFDSISMCPVI